MALAQQSQSDGIKAVARLEAQGDVVGDAQPLDHPGQTGQAAAQEHGQDKGLGYVHPAVAGGAGIGPDGPQLETPGGLEQEPPGDERHHQGQHKAPVQGDGVIQEAGQVGALGNILGAAGPLGEFQRPTKQPFAQAKDQIVHHNRRDHLVGAGLGLEQPGDGRPQPGSDGPGGNGQRQVEDHRQAGEGKADDDRDQPTDADLPFGADIEQARPETQGHGQPGENVGNRLHQAVAGATHGAQDRAQALAGQGASDGFQNFKGVAQRSFIEGNIGPRQVAQGQSHRLADLPPRQGVEHLLVGEHDHHCADEQRRDHRQDRDGQGPQPGSQPAFHPRPTAPPRRKQGQHPQPQQQRQGPQPQGDEQHQDQPLADQGDQNDQGREHSQPEPQRLGGEPLPPLQSAVLFSQRSRLLSPVPAANRP